MNNPQPKEIANLKLDRQVTIVRYSPCAKYLIAGGFESVIYRWDATIKDMPAMPLLTGHGGWVTSLAFSSDQKHLFSVDSWGQLRAWNYPETNPKCIWFVKEAHDGWVRDVVVSPDGKTLATCGKDQKVRLWSTKDGKKLREWDDHHEDVFCVAFHPNGQTLISGNLKGKLKQHHVGTGKLERELDASVLYKEHRLQDVGGARVLRFDAKGEILACAGTTPKNGANVQGMPTILLFDWKSGKVKHEVKIGATSDAFVYDLHLHPEGYIIAVTSGNPGVGKLAMIRPGEEKPFFLHTKILNCHSLAMHPDGKRFVVSGTNRGSNGNGRRLKDGEYLGNNSPLHVFEI